MTEAPLSREAILASTLAELGNVWLAVTCSGCGRVEHPPSVMLSRSGLGSLRVSEVIGRLRFRQCGARPSSVGLTSFPVDPSNAQYEPWVVQLTP